MSNDDTPQEGTPETGVASSTAGKDGDLDFREAARFLSEMVPQATGDGVADDMQDVLRTILVRGDDLEPRPASAWRRFFRGALGNKRRERDRRTRRIERRLTALRELRRQRGLAPPPDAEFADAAFAALLTLERQELVCLLRADWLDQPLRQIADEVFSDPSPTGIAGVHRRVRRARETLRRTLGSLCPLGLRQAERVADHGRLAKCLAALSKALRL